MSLPINPSKCDKFSIHLKSISKPSLKDMYLKLQDLVSPPLDLTQSLDFCPCRFCSNVTASGNIFQSSTQPDIPLLQYEEPSPPWFQSDVACPAWFQDVKPGPAWFQDVKSNFQCLNSPQEPVTLKLPWGSRKRKGEFTLPDSRVLGASLAHLVTPR